MKHPLLTILLVLIFAAGKTTAQDRYHVLLNHGSLPKINSGAYTSDGGYIFCGTSRFGTTGIGEFFKLRPDLSIEWSNYFYEPDTTIRLNSITEIPTGGYLLAGSTGDSAGTHTDMVLIRCNASGNPIWIKSYDAGDRDELISAIVNSDGSITATGTVIYDPVIRKKDILFCHFDSFGNLISSQTSGTTQVDNPSAMSLTSDGLIAIAGTVSDSVNGDSFFLSKSDTAGNSIWGNAYFLSSNNRCSSFFQSNDGGYFIAGNDDSTGSAILVKVDSTGSIQIAKSFQLGTGTGIFQLQDVRVLSAANEGYLLSAKGVFGQSASFILFKISNNLFPEWAMSYELVFNLENENKVLLQTPDLGCLLAGNYKNVYQGGTNKILFVKTDSLGGSGCRETSEIIAEQFENPLQAIYNVSNFTLNPAPIPFSPLFVNGGWSSDSLCGSTTGIQNNTASSRVFVYPSPFTDQLFIDIDANSNYRRLQVSDVTGKLILNTPIISPYQSPIILPTTDWAAGKYIITLTSEQGYIHHSIVIHQSK